MQVVILQVVWNCPLTIFVLFDPWIQRCRIPPRTQSTCDFIVYLIVSLYRVKHCRPIFLANSGSECSVECTTWSNPWFFWLTLHQHKPYGSSRRENYSQVTRGGWYGVSRAPPHHARNDRIRRGQMKHASKWQGVAYISDPNAWGGTKKSDSPSVQPLSHPHPPGSMIPNKPL